MKSSPGLWQILCINNNTFNHRYLMASKALSPTFCITYLTLMFILLNFATFRYVHVEERIPQMISNIRYFIFVFTFIINFEILANFSKLYLYRRMFLHKIPCNIHFLEAIKSILTSIFSKINWNIHQFFYFCWGFVLRINTGKKCEIFQTVNFIIILNFWIWYQNSLICVWSWISTKIVFALARILIEIINNSFHTF